jgi:hypothetical protein
MLDCAVATRETFHPFISNLVLSGEKSAVGVIAQKQISLLVRNYSGFFLKVAP